jgi:hypothetical protein
MSKTLSPAKPIEPSEELLQQSMIVRQGLGLRSDPEFVKEILVNPERFDALAGPLTGGHHATPEEVEAIKIRLILQEDAIALTPELEDIPEFAGIFINEKNVINIGFTFDAEKRVSELRNKVKLPDRLQAFTAERSMKELENSKQRALNVSQELLANDVIVSQVAMDIENNTLKLGVVDLDSEKLQLIQRILGPVDVFDKPLNEVENRADTAAPMRAGVRITNSTGGGCTSNWKARDRTTGQFVSVTAGHCGTDVNGTFGGSGEAFFQGTSSTGAARQLGVSDQTTWTFPTINAAGNRTGSNPVDAVRIPFASNIFSMPWLYAFDGGNSGVFSDSEAARVGAVDGTVVIGSIVCSGGQFSPGNQIGGNNWKNCGSVNAVNVANAFRRQTGSADIFTVLNSNEATYTAIGGDSGSPTWRIAHNATQGWHAIAVGHHTGGPAGSEVFNDIDRVENALNVDIRFF